MRVTAEEGVLEEGTPRDTGLKRQEWSYGQEPNPGGLR